MFLYSSEDNIIISEEQFTTDSFDVSTNSTNNARSPSSGIVTPKNAEDMFLNTSSTMRINAGSSTIVQSANSTSTCLLALSDKTNYQPSTNSNSGVPFELNCGKSNSKNINEALNNNKAQTNVCETADTMVHYNAHDCSQKPQLQRPRRSSRNIEDSSRRKSSRNTRNPLQNTQQTTRTRNIAVGSLLDLPSGYGNSTTNFYIKQNTQ